MNIPATTTHAQTSSIPDPTIYHAQDEAGQPGTPIQLLASVYDHSQDPGEWSEFGGTMIWAGQRMLADGTTYASMNDAQSAAAHLSDGNGPAVAVVPTSHGYDLHPALVESYADSYADADDWIGGRGTGVKPLDLETPDHQMQNQLKLLPPFGPEFKTHLLGYIKHAPDNVVIVDGQLRATLSQQDGLHVSRST